MHMKKIILLAALVVCVFRGALEVEAGNGSIDALVKEYDAETVEEAENMNEIVQILYSNLCDQKGSAIKYAQNIDLDKIDTLIQSALAMDMPMNDYDGVILWANIDYIEKAIVQKDGASYIFLKATFRYSFDEMKSYIAHVVDGLDFSGKSDAEKINVIFDFIRDNYGYDNTLSVFDCITAQKNGNNKMVCQGYSTLAYLLGKSVGLDIEILVSKTHSWNCVRLDNDAAYTQFDVTNNKRIGERLSNTESYEVRADYFLYSNKDIKLKEEKGLFARLF